MTRLATFAFLLSLLFVPNAWSQNHRTALADYKRGEYAAAFKAWRALALKGDADAQFNVGLMYETGQGVPQDYARALAWYSLAAKRGIADAQINLGWMYENGLGVPKDQGKAAMWYLRAAKQGHAVARDNIALVSTAKKSDARAPARPAFNRAGFRVQLGSFKSKQRAEKQAAQILQAYKSIDHDLKLITVPATLGDRGVFYRVRSEPLSDRASAISLCQEIASLHRGCLVIEP